MDVINTLAQTGEEVLTWQKKRKLGFYFATTTVFKLNVTESNASGL